MRDRTVELAVDGAPELHPVISPSRRWVRFVHDGLSAVPADGTSPSKRLTQSADGVRWAPDSRSLSFVMFLHFWAVTNRLTLGLRCPRGSRDRRNVRVNGVWRVHVCDLVKGDSFAGTRAAGGLFGCACRSARGAAETGQEEEIGAHHHVVTADQTCPAVRQSVFEQPPDHGAAKVPSTHHRVAG